MDCPSAAAAIVATTVASAAATAEKEDNKDDYPAAVSAEDTVISVTHITDLLSSSLTYYVSLKKVLRYRRKSSEKIF